MRIVLIATMAFSFVHMTTACSNTETFDKGTNVGRLLNAMLMIGERDELTDYDRVRSFLEDLIKNDDSWGKGFRAGRKWGDVDGLHMLISYVYSKDRAEVDPSFGYFSESVAYAQAESKKRKADLWVSSYSRCIDYDSSMKLLGQRYGRAIALPPPPDRRSPLISGSVFLVKRGREGLITVTLSGPESDVRRCSLRVTVALNAPESGTFLVDP